MNKVFFTSDTHFGHFNIIKYCNRPFTSSSEMDAHIINKWNKKVSFDDIVYHLGDFAFCKTYEDIEKYRSRLNGKIYLIFGNHDRKKLFFRNNFESTGDYREIVVNDQSIVLSHYAFRVWNKSHCGSWHLYGHSHGTLPDDPTSLSIDVGVDCHNFEPLSFEEVAKIMSKKNFAPKDHHGA